MVVANNVCRMKLSESLQEHPQDAFDLSFISAFTFILFHLPFKIGSVITDRQKLMRLLNGLYSK